MATVRDVMTPGAAKVHAEDTLAQAARAMREHDIGAVPVTDAGDRLLGLVTDRDVVVNAVADGKNPDDTTVGAIVHGRPVTVDASEPITKAVQAMATNRVRRLPVLDGERLVGMVSLADIARNLPSAVSGELLTAISAPGKGSGKSADKPSAKSSAKAAATAAGKAAASAATAAAGKAKKAAKAGS